MKNIAISIVIPMFNEEGSIIDTIDDLTSCINKSGITYEILIIDDNSTDNSKFIAKKLSNQNENIRYLLNENNRGFGNAVKFGLNNFKGDVVVIAMADASDKPEDILTFYKKLISTNSDCVFGNRFCKGGETIKYPFIKLIINRIFNNFIRIFVQRNYADYTNAFKMYKKEVIESLRPFKSSGFSLTLEIPLKVIKNKYTYEVVPNSWTNRKAGYSKLNILKNSKSYLLIFFNFFTNKL